MRIQMPAIIFLMLFFPFSLHASELPPLAQKAQKLFEIGEYENSLMLFEECYQDSRNPNCISAPINLLNQAFSLLPKQSRNYITTFKPEKKNISLTDFIKKEISERINNFSFLDVFGLATGTPITSGIDLDQYSRLYHFIAGENLPGSPISISKPEDMAKITSEIPFFKSWIQKLSELSRNCYSHDDQAVCLEYMKQISDLKKKLDTYYRNFFSYDIASPILAKTQQLIFIADTSKFIGVDETMMRDAAKVLGTLNDDIIQYVNQDVRNQFLDVVKEFREKAGKELAEELKVIQTLQDKFVNNRYTEPMF